MACSLMLALAGGVVFGLGGHRRTSLEPSHSALATPGAVAPRLKLTSAERWRLPLPGKVVGMPAVAGDAIYVTTDDTVVAVSPSGKVSWSTPFPETRVYAPRVDDDSVFIAGEHGLVALRRATGEVLWRFASGDGKGTRVNRPAVMGDVVVAATDGGRVVGLDRATGALRWDTAMATEVGAEVAVLDGVAVIVGRGEWGGFDAATGHKIWSGDLGLIGTSSPVVFPTKAGPMAAVASDEKFVAVGLRDGQPRWEAQADQSELAQVPLATAAGELLVPDHWGRLTAYRAGDGAIVWKAKGADGVAQLGQPVLLGRRLVALTLDLDGPRIASDRAALALRPPSPGLGVAGLPDGGLLVSTWGDDQNYLMAYDLDLGN